MTETDLMQEVLDLIELNGKATQKYLFDVFVNCKKKYNNISKYQIKKALENLIRFRKIQEKIKTKIAVILPSKLKLLELRSKTELKNKLTNGIVKPAPTEIRTKGESALNIIFQS